MVTACETTATCLRIPLRPPRVNFFPLPPKKRGAIGAGFLTLRMPGRRLLATVERLRPFRLMQIFRPLRGRGVGNDGREVGRLA